MSLLLLLLTTLPMEPQWFYVGDTPQIAVIEADSTINGVPVQRSGWLVARADDPVALEALDEVAEVRILAGDGHVVRVRPATGVDEITLSRLLRERGDAAWAHPDLAMRLVPRDMPNDPFVDDQWHLENTGQSGWTPGSDIDAETAWAVSTGLGAMIAVFDSGIDLEHPDLIVTPGYDYVGRDDDPSPDLSTDEAPHGTAAAGLAAAVGDNGIGVAGVAYDSEVYAVRLIGDGTYISDIYDGFVEAVDAGAWVLSNSWGFGDDCPEIPEYDAFVEGMAYAEEVGRDGLGAAVVVSAGNGNCDISNDGFQAQPAAISVAATTGDDEREWYSSFGDHVDVAAPSGGVLTTDISGDDGYGSWEDDPDYHGGFGGTSASAPIVSGTVALMFAANDRLTAAQAREVLCDTAVRVDTDSGGYDATGWSAYYGCGRIDAGAAVLAVADEGGPGEPTLIAPLEQAWVDRVVLQWEPVTDPDGDWIVYAVTYRISETDAEDVVVTTTTTHLDLTGVVPNGAKVTWRVEARDLWGSGGASDDAVFQVVQFEVEEEEPEPEVEEDSGCALAPSASGPVFAPLLLLLAAALLSRRIR